MAKSRFSRRRTVRRAAPDQHIRERHFVPDEVGVYVCEQHRPVGLEVPEASWKRCCRPWPFWPRGTSNTTETVARRASLGSPLISGSRQLLHYSRWPMANASVPRYRLYSFTKIVILTSGDRACQPTTHCKSSVPTTLDERTRGTLCRF